MKVYAVLYSKCGDVLRICATKKMAEDTCNKVQGINDLDFHVEEYEVEDAKTVYVLEDTNYETRVAWSLDREEIEEREKKLGHRYTFIQETTNYD